MANDSVYEQTRAGPQFAKWRHRGRSWTILPTWSNTAVVITVVDYLSDPDRRLDIPHCGGTRLAACGSRLPTGEGSRRAESQRRGTMNRWIRQSHRQLVETKAPDPGSRPSGFDLLEHVELPVGVLPVGSSTIGSPKHSIPRRVFVALGLWSDIFLGQ